MIKSFEGARGAAALVVALFHMSLGEPRILPLPGAYVFVDLFFVLSGLLICSAYSPKLAVMSDLPSFLLRRFGRLFPLLIFATAAFVAMLNAGVLAHHVLGAAARPFIVPTLAELVATLTMSYSLGLFDHVILNYASWSISTEFYAYILFALLCLLFRGRARLLAFAVTAAAGYLVTAWATIDVHQCLKWGGCLDLTFDFGFARCAAGFFLGALLCQMPAAVRTSSGLMQLAALGAIFLMFGFMHRYPIVALGAPLLFGVFLLAVGSDTGFVAAFLSTRPMQVLGERSYSIYLMHPVILLPFNLARPYAGSALRATLFVLAYLGVLLLVSGWTYRLVEDPARKFFNRIAGARHRAGSQTASGVKTP